MNLNVYAWGGLITAFTNLAISSLVYLKNRRGLVNKIFPLYTLSIGLWSFSWFKLITSPNEAVALQWSKVLSLGSILIPAFFLHFICAITNIIKEKRKIIIANYIFASMLLFFCFFTNLFIKEVAPIFSFKYFFGPGPVYIWHFLSFAIVTIYGGFLLFKASKKCAGLKRNQIRYLFWALVIGYSGGTTAFFPIYKIPMPSLAVYTIPICVIIIAYTIVKYRLMDISVAVTRTGIFVAVYTLVLGLPFAIVVWLRSWLIRMWGINWWILPLLILVVSAMGGPFIYIYLERKAEKRLLYEQHRYQETLRQAAREMARIRNLKKLLSLIVHTVTKTVRIFYAGIYLFDAKSNQFILEASRSLKKIQSSSISKESPLILWLQEHKEPLVYEEINRQVQGDFNPTFKELDEQMQFLNAAVIVPGFLEDRLLGILILGDKRSGKIYTSEDLNTFSLLANQAALAVENALLYENIEEQVRQRTEELVDTQKQLIQAEKLATIGTLAGGVAHEINNPLTAILTNAQMLLAERSKIDSDSRESLELIEEATKRCRTIVQKLMTYAKKPLEYTDVSRVNLFNVVKNTVSFLDYQLEQENIKIITPAKEDNYLVMGNQNELEQLVTNIVLNARDAIRQIKKSGIIEISLFRDNNWINLQIKDEGAGIPKEIIPKIFDPFFTTKEVGRGLGLGLSICQAIAERHNGLISVQSQLNKGSIFTIRLPKAKIESKLKTRV